MMKLLYLILFSLIFFGCINQKTTLSPSFFAKAKNESLSPFIFDSVSLLNGRDGYKMSIMIMDTLGRDCLLPGIIYMKENVIWFRFDDSPNDTFRLFDFNMKLKERIKISRDSGVPGIMKDYILKLDDKFFYSSYQDTVYHFLFENFRAGKAFENSHAFVLRDYGIVGTLLEVVRDTSLGCCGRIVDRRGNIFKDIIDYSHYTFGNLQ